jgi:uncharacterized protein
MENKKISLVTGASSGLGKIIAKMLCQKSHKVYVTARRENLLQNLKKECEKLGGEIVVISGDLSDPSFRINLVNQIIKNEKKIDYLINNAGFGKAVEFSKENQEEIGNMFKVNVVAYQHLTRLVLPHMKKQNSGRLIQVGSVVAFTPLPYFTTYNATKAAVYMFNRALRYELVDTKVTSTIVLPARMNTGFATHAFDCSFRKDKNACADEFNKMAGKTEKVAKQVVRNINKGKRIILPTFKSRLWYFMRHFEVLVDLIMKKGMGAKQLRHLKKDAELKKEK